MQTPAYRIIAPEICRTSVVFASPHSGCDYPEWFIRRSLLNAHTIRSSEDAFVDQLFSAAPAVGAPFLMARAPRALLDLNRSAEELDPALIQGVRKVGHNPRVASGLGVIPRVVANGRAIYHGKMTRAEADHRIDTYWRPYHDALSSLLTAAHDTFGEAILIDCHSMPREAVEGVSRRGGQRPEIVLGDRFGAAADGDIVDQIEAAFQQAGFVVSRNSPFAGAYVTQHYGRPQRRQHAIQIEIDRSLYMDEALITPHSDFAAFQARLQTVVAQIAAIGTPRKKGLAAE
ncbi:N-formylglutamate amidohydrolase [Shimia marina]|uniref:N-formylglutamate deformylase n=1 Tax=Shimia marina TaxID=321267 RepID=A0A0P1EMP3_9RHOB|nr:N-formylglutamate amidohydrolase [Shimia marina]CUH51626.1 N-formylglutamate deformylase [Shimia marina]SFD44355.1 N-formylglutamate deformylase [Shimia marina]